ncbi:MAG: hypothetical protein AB4372_22355 [Xenococcus sp. (in: cyanobacteria)]
MKKLSLLFTLSLFTLISTGTVVKADSRVENANQSPDGNSLIISDGDIEIEGLEDVQPEEIEVITGEVYEVHEVDELELLKEIAEVSTEIE